MHKRVLQLLQRRHSTERWVLNRHWQHLQSIPELVETYPDASFIVTHRTRPRSSPRSRR